MKRIVPVLDHARREPRYEHLCRRVDTAQHNVSAPPIHKADHVCVDLCHEEGHGADGLHRAHADVFWCEPHLGSNDSGCGTERCRNIGTAYCGPLNSVENCGTYLSGVAPCFCECTTRRRMAATAHAQGCPVAPCPINSPLAPFFCVINRKITKVEAAQVVEEALVAWVG